MKTVYLSVLSIIVALIVSCAKPGKIKIMDKGVYIAYADTGKGDTTLLFVHGWCINQTYWDDQVKFFSPKYRVITVDLPGFGKSGKNRTDWSPVAFGRDIQTAIEALQLKNVILIGHSMAGDIIVQAANNSPQQVVGLIGIDNFKNVGVGAAPTKKDSDDYKVAIDSLHHHFKKMAFEYVNQDLFYKTTSEAVRNRVLHDVANADSSIAASCLELNDFDEVKELKKTGKKLCLVNSDVKPTNTAGLKANGIPFQVWYIHNSGHFPMIENPARFNSVLAQAIQKIKD